MHVLPRAVPDMNPHGCRHNAIDDYVPSVCNRKAALAAPGCGHANSRVFEDQTERVLYALSDHADCAGAGVLEALRVFKMQQRELTCARFNYYNAIIDITREIHGQHHHSQARSIDESSPSRSSRAP